MTNGSKIIAGLRDAVAHARRDVAAARVSTVAMTRDEFIDSWMQNCGLPAECRTADGIQFPGDAHGPWRALPCACREESCRGWAITGSLIRA